MEIATRLVDLTDMHPRLLWGEIIGAVVCVVSNSDPAAAFRFSLEAVDLPGLDTDTINLTIDPAGVSKSHVDRLRRTYEMPRLIELAAIAIAGLGLYYGGGHEMLDVAVRGSSADYLVDETNHLMEIAGRSRRADLNSCFNQKWQRLSKRQGTGFYVCVVEFEGRTGRLAYQA